MQIDRTELRAIAICCRNSAAMLRLADNGDADPARRERLISFNCGQANLLEQAAEMAESANDPRMDGMSNAAVSEEVVRLVQALAGTSKIEAIKSYRTLTGYGLKESKAAVEMVMDRLLTAAR